MKKQILITIAVIIIINISNLLNAQDTIKLVPPEKKGIMSLMEALEKRKSTRSFSEAKITPSLQTTPIVVAPGTQEGMPGCDCDPYPSTIFHLSRCIHKITY